MRCKEMDRGIGQKISVTIRPRSGEVLILALMFLAIVSIMVGPVMNIVSSGLKQGTAIENRTNQTYIADSGIESACQRILKGQIIGDDGTSIYNYGDPPISYTIHDVNGSGSSTHVTISFIDNGDQGQTYQVSSVGTDLQGKHTTIEADILAKTGGYFSFLNNVGTTNGVLNVTSSSGHVSLEGTVQADGIGGVPNFHGQGGLTGPYGGVWPTIDELKNYYASEVPTTSPDYHPSGWTVSGTLQSTQYVVGDCQIGADVDLNGFAIFADGNITSGHGIYVGGPGVVAATGDIQTAPKDTTDPSSGILYYASGTVSFWPSNHFYGWIAAENQNHATNGIDIKQGNWPTFDWVQPNPYVYLLDFPGLLAGGPSVRAGGVAILNWNITSQ
jgi:hypothetical protein